MTAPTQPLPEPPAPPRRAWLFPGQGTQFVGMGVALAQAFPAARRLFELADDVLQEPLSRIMAEGPAERLMATEVTQPAVLTYSLALLAVLREHGATATVSAGYSLGEYAALVAAGVLDDATAIRLVRARAAAMVRAHPLDTRAMLVVLGPERAILDEVLTRAPADEVLTVAGYCAPTLHSISGSPGGLDWLTQTLEHEGIHAQVRSVPVSLPFHCRLLAPAQAELAALLAVTPFRPPTIPVITNVSAQPETDPDRLRALLVEQVVHPVRWVESMAALRALNITEVWELGPGRSLTGYLRKIDPTFRRVNVEDSASLQAVLGG